MGSPSHRHSRRSERERDRTRDRRDDESRSATRRHDKREARDDVKEERERHRSRSPHSRDHRRHYDDRERRDRDSEKYDPRKKIKEEPETDNEMSQRRRRTRESEDVSNFDYGTNVKPEEEKETVEKQKPNFGLSGKLSEETNVCNGVVVKYSEPAEARVPKRRWRFYVFRGEESLPTLYIHRQSAYLLGRDRKVADIPVDHPSCSKQHAVLQYRLVNYDRPDGTVGRSVRPYIIDLESANGTFVNNQKIEPKRYVELFEKDVLKFGFSSREYVLLHEESKTQAAEDDLGE